MLGYYQELGLRMPGQLGSPPTLTNANLSGEENKGPCYMAKICDAHLLRERSGVSISRSSNAFAIEGYAGLWENCGRINVAPREQASWKEW
jgi:hypothetical protein